MRDVRSDAGFTIVEMLVVTLIGGIVLMALFNLVDASDRATTRVQQRIDSSQRGRLAMEQVTQSLRSQVCIKDDPVLSPLADGTGGTKLSFYAAFPRKVTGQAKPTDFMPEKRTISYDTVTKRITEEIFPGSGTYPDITFPSTPTRRRVVATDIVPAATGAPLFTYYGLEDDGSVSPAPMVLPLDANEREGVVRLDVAFVAVPSQGKALSGTQTSLESSIAVRLPTRTDSDNPGSGPACML
jgi:prepilin-type N-terminal cleavage/methylation domain-containing protein